MQQQKTAGHSSIFYYNDVIWTERWKYFTENLNMNMHKLLKVKHPDTEEKYVCYIEQLHKNCVLH